MTKKEKDQTERKAESSASFGFGGLLDGIQKLVETAAKLKESGDISQTGEFSIPGLGEKGKGIFGFSVRTLVGAEGQQEVKVQPFGNIHKTRQGVAVEEAREPVADVFEEGEQIRVIAELPGVSESDIKYEVKGDILTISTEGDRRYNAEVLLPSPVESAGIESSYNNGIFELRLTKAKK